MFPGYAKKEGNRPPHRMFEQPMDVNRKVKLALQIGAKRAHDKEKADKARDEDGQTFQQSGYGESDSDDDCGGVRVKIEDEDHIQHVEACMTLPQHRKHKQEALAKAGRDAKNGRNASGYSTFPYGKQPVNPYASSSSTNRKRSRSRESRRRSSSVESRSTSYSRRSGHRDDNEDRKKKKKKRRRKSSSSSDSDRSHRHVEEKKTKGKKIPKYEFLKKEEYNDTFGDWMYAHRKLDYENFSLGMPKGEIARAKLGVGAILGYEQNVDMFKHLYGQEYTFQNRVNARSFFDQLAADENRPADTLPIMETQFLRRHALSTDEPLAFIRIEDSAHLFNQLNEETEEILTPEQMRERELKKLKKHVHDCGSDVDAVLKLIKMEEDHEAENAGSFTSTGVKELAIKHIDQLYKSIKNSPRNVQLRLKLINCHFLADEDATKCYEAFEDLCSKFPQEPLVWREFHNFVQHEKFDFKTMQTAFESCMDKACDLLSGTIRSHHISDLPAFRSHYLGVYIRYMKYLMAVGHTPFVLGSIQATMEFNFGITDTESPNRRTEILKDYWNSGYPRIGDKEGCGTTKMMHTAWPEGCDAKFEKDDYEELHRAVVDNAQHLLGGDDLRMNWVNFERFMADVDARVKRTPFESSDPFLKDKDEMNVFHFFEEIPFRDRAIRMDTARPHIMTFYASIENEAFEFVQPLLEFMGIKFYHSTGYYSMTEHLISEFITYGSFRKYVSNFEEVPTYTENTFGQVGERILKFLIGDRHELCKGTPKVLDEQLMRYAFAFVETKLSKKEKTIRFYKLPVRIFRNCMQDVLVSLEETCKTYPLLKPLLGLYMTDRFVQWTERAINELKELRRLDKLREKAPNAKECEVLNEHLASEADDENLKAVKTQLFSMLNAINKTVVTSVGGPPKKLGDPSLPYNFLQIQLYSAVIRSRLYVLPDSLDRVCIDLAIALMEDDEFIIKRLYERKRLWEHVDKNMKDLVLIIEKRDEAEIEMGIPEMPRARALCKAFQLAASFVFLGTNELARTTVKKMTDEVIGMFAAYEKSATDFTRSNFKRQRDRIDLQFLLDTLISLYNQEGNQIYYCTHYEQLIKVATITFNCTPKYMKMWAELKSNNRPGLLDLLGDLGKRNKVIRREMKDKVDVSYERRLLMNSLTSMYATKRVCDRAEVDMKAWLYKKYKNEAMQLYDPAIWRLVFKQAAAVSLHTLKEDAFMRSTEHCIYARNIHIDCVEHIVRIKKDDDLDEETRQKQRILAIDNAILPLFELHKQHTDTLLFIDDTEELVAHQDVMRVQMR